MLIEFVATNREKLIALTRAKVAKRFDPPPTERELASGVPLFLDQLAETLRSPPASMTETIERTAAVHGAALLNPCYTAAQVVYDYGELCQALTGLATAIASTITPAPSQPPTHSPIHSP